MSETPLTAEGFAGEVDVSRETLQRLALYLELLQQWQPRINLVSESTLADPWRRHLLDSAQLRPHLPPYLPQSVGLNSPSGPPPGPLVDLGSGAGFPAMVLAILGEPGVVLVESDVRKSAFLREVAARTGTAVTIQAKRAEALTLPAARAVTARGFAPLVRLLPAAVRFLALDGVAVLLKGKRHQDEVTEARKDWQFAVHSSPSRSDPDGVILHLSEIRRLPTGKRS